MISDSNNEEIVVSVICIAYNHKNYIRKALDGFIKQETKYKYEVIVHDDASTDGTDAIIREYAARYPDIIKPILQKENQYSKKVGIIKTFILPVMRGKYVAFCDGDDYWTDPHKIQEQTEALERHTDCSASLSKVEAITCDGKPRKLYFPRFKAEGGIIPSEEFIKRMLDPGPFIVSPVQWSGLMCRAEIYRQYYEENLAFINAFTAIQLGDVPIELYLGLKGNIYFIDSVMSHYRTLNPNSFVGKKNKDKATAVRYRYEKVHALEAFDKDTDFAFHEKVKTAVAYTEFSALSVDNDLKAMKSDKYRWLYKQLPLPKKLGYHVFYFAPWTEKPIKTLWAMVRK